MLTIRNLLLVMLTGYLFLPLSGRAANLHLLTDTGQTTCYEAGWVGNVLDPCPAPGEPFYGQDANYSGLAMNFTDNGDGTVTDNNTSLMWQQETADTDNDGGITTADNLPWQDAIDYCAALDFAGYTDWRLPEVFELRTTVDFGRSSMIAPVFAKYYDLYWSANHHVGNTSFAWVMNYSTGGANWYEKIYPQAAIRCVRSSL